MTLTEEIREEAKAKAEAKAETIAEGRAQGRKEAESAIVKHMLLKGYDLKSIAKITGLPYEQLSRLTLGELF